MFRPPTCSVCVLSIHHWEFPTGASWSPKPIILGGSTSVFNWEVGPGSFWWVIVLNDYSYTSGRTNYYAGHRCPFPIGSLVNWRTLWDESPMEEAISIGNWIVATKQGVPQQTWKILNHLEFFRRWNTTSWTILKPSVSHCFFIFFHVFLQNPTLAAGRTSSLTLLTRIAGRKHRNLGVWSIPLCRKAGGTHSHGAGPKEWLDGLCMFMSSENFQKWIKNHHLFRV